MATSRTLRTTAMESRRWNRCGRFWSGKQLQAARDRRQPARRGRLRSASVDVDRSSCSERLPAATGPQRSACGVWLIGDVTERLELQYDRSHDGGRFQQLELQGRRRVIPLEGRLEDRLRACASGHREIDRLLILVRDSRRKPNLNIPECEETAKFLLEHSPDSRCAATRIEPA